MMSSQHQHQQQQQHQQRSPSTQIPVELAENSDKILINHSGKNDEGNNENKSYGNESKELVCEPEIDLNNDNTSRINNSTFNQRVDNENEKADDEDEMENHSFRSDQAIDDWSNKPLKCTLCSQVCHSPTEFEEHIKAHLHAAAVAANSMSATIKTTADVAS